MTNKIMIGLLGGILLIGFWVMTSYNGLVSSNLAVETQWAQVETQYQRRFDLIPTLVASVKGAMGQESEIFTAIANARQGYAGAKTINEKAIAAGNMESALGRLLVITENYPQLASIGTVKDLMTQLEGTENRVSTERKRFNDLVEIYNKKVITFPGNILASMFGFEKRTFFKSAENAEKMPVVDFKK